MHPFTVRDWARIGRKVPPPQNFNEALTTVAICFELVRSIADYLFQWLPQYRVGQLIFNEIKEIVLKALDKMVDEYSGNDDRIKAILKAIDALNAI